MERRLSPRKPLRIKARLTANGSLPMMVKTVDVGRFGMGVIGIARSLAIGQEVRVEFEMAVAGQVHQIDVNSRVSHCTETASDGFKAGLQFVELDPATAALLGRYVGD